MTGGKPRDDGAILILVLAILTAILSALVVIPKLAYTTSRADRAQVQHGRVVSALSNAMQGEIENLHASGTGPTCDGGLDLPAADGPQAPGSTAAPIEVKVTCAEDASPAPGIDNLEATSDAPGACVVLDASVSFAGNKVAITSWQLEPRCSP